MSNTIIDFSYAKKSIEQLNRLEVNNITEAYSTPINLIMDFHIDLASLALTLKLKKDLGLNKVILNDLIMILNRMRDIAIFLDIELIVEVQHIQVTDPELILNSMFNHVSMLNYKKATSRAKMIYRIVPLFAELVYSLRFTLDDLERAYYKNMDTNILEME